MARATKSVLSKRAMLPDIVVLGDAKVLTGSVNQHNLSDGPPHGQGWKKGAGEADD